MATTTATSIHGTCGADGRVYRLGEFASHREAEQMVDRLSDAEFPVERVRIFGAGSQSFERVAGHVTRGRAALIGAGLGGWLGMVGGMMLAVSVAGAAWLTVLMASPLIGAAAGATMGFITHWATDGRGDITRTTGPRAQRYVVEVDTAHAAEAVQALNRSWAGGYPWLTSGTSRRRSGAAGCRGGHACSRCWPVT
jgi:hypothetical protein